MAVTAAEANGLLAIGATDVEGAGGRAGGPPEEGALPHGIGLLEFVNFRMILFFFFFLEKS